jgi:hypothetical protein
MALKRKIYRKIGDKNWEEKYDINNEIYWELADKAKEFFREPTKEELEKYMCFRFVESVHSGFKDDSYIIYEILSNPYNFSNDEIALICCNAPLSYGGMYITHPESNLSYGYTKRGNKIKIYTSERKRG